MSITITASAVAWYGALLGTAGFGLSVYNAWTLRPRLRVSICERLATGDFLSFRAHEPFWMIEAANIGKGTIYLSGLPWFRLRSHTGSQGCACVGDWHTTDELAEGTSANLFIKKQEGIELTDICAIVVKDKAGRKWKGLAEIKGQSRRKRLLDWLRLYRL